MRSKNKELMINMVDFINDYFRDFNNTPTIRKISERFNLAKSSVQRYLVSMDESGMIEYCNGEIITDYIRKISIGGNYTPLVGGIPCGDPNVEDSVVEEYVNLPCSIFGNGNYYLLIAKFDSMEDVGIHDGDVLVIEPAQTAEIGDIVVALDDEGQNTLKKYNGYNNVTKKFELLYCNQSRYPDRVIEIDKLTIQGVLKFVIKKM